MASNCGYALGMEELSDQAGSRSAATTGGPGRPSSQLLAAALVVLSPAAVACGAGQVAQTAEQVTAAAGARVGEISVVDVEFLFDGPVAGDEVNDVGAIAPLAVTIVNHGSAADRLLRVSSPIATRGLVVGTTSRSRAARP